MEKIRFDLSERLFVLRFSLLQMRSVYRNYDTHLRVTENQFGRRSLWVSARIVTEKRQCDFSLFPVHKGLGSIYCGCLVYVTYFSRRYTYVGRYLSAKTLRRIDSGMDLQLWESKAPEQWSRELQKIIYFDMVTRMNKVSFSWQVHGTQGCPVGKFWEEPVASSDLAKDQELWIKCKPRTD